MRSAYRILLLLIFVFAYNLGQAQLLDSSGNLDSNKVKPVVIDSIPKHSPRLATWLSVIVPGAGQFYNKSYWKIPVIYAAGGALVYSTIQNSNGYHSFLNAYNHLYENPSSPMEGFENYSLDQLKSVKDQYRRYRDLSVIGLVLLYTMNIVDATVDGYFFDYDIGDDLSFRIEPRIMNSYYRANTFKASQQYGFKCTINF